MNSKRPTTQAWNGLNTSSHVTWCASNALVSLVDGWVIWATHMTGNFQYVFLQRCWAWLRYWCLFSSFFHLIHIWHVFPVALLCSWQTFQILNTTSVARWQMCRRLAKHRKSWIWTLGPTRQCWEVTWNCEMIPSAPSASHISFLVWFRCPSSKPEAPSFRLQRLPHVLLPCANAPKAIFDDDDEGRTEIIQWHTSQEFTIFVQFLVNKMASALEIASEGSGVHGKVKRFPFLFLKLAITCPLVCCLRLPWVCYVLLVASQLPGFVSFQSGGPYQNSDDSGGLLRTILEFVNLTFRNFRKDPV